MDNGMSQGHDATVSEPAQGNHETHEVKHDSSEKTFRQQEINDIVQRAKRDAVDSYRRNQEAQQYNNQQVRQEYSIDSDRVKNMAEEAARKYIDQTRQEILQQSHYEASQRTVNNFWSKVNAGRSKYQDFDGIAGDIDLKAFPNVVQLLGDYMDNSADVLYYLGNDRFKLSELETMAMRSPADAIKAAQRLSQTLKDNQVAEKIRLPNEPLSQVRPSNTGTDSGALSVSDYRKRYKV